MKKQDQSPPALAPAKTNPPDKPRRDSDGLHRRRGIFHFCLTVDGQRKFFSTGTKSYQEARRIRSDAERAQKENRLPNDLSKAAFETVLQKVLDARQMHVGEGTARIDKERSTALLRCWTGRRISTINSQAIRDWQKRRSGQVSGRTCNLEFRLIRAVLQTAGTWASVGSDYRPLRENRQGPGRALSSANERLLLDVARSRAGSGGEVALYAAMISANTTARSCEVRGLRIADINLIDKEFFIRKSKTDAGTRRIPCNEATCWALVRLLERAHGFGAKEPEHFLLPRFLYKQTKNSNGAVAGYDPTQPQKTFRTAWRSLVKETARQAGRKAAREAIASGNGWRAGIAEWRRAAKAFTGLRFHDLRHLAVTKLAESGASDEVVMAVAGHLSRAMMSHYSHIRSEAKRRAIDSIESYVPPAPSEPKIATSKLQ
jgi:integrase